MNQYVSEPKPDSSRECNCVGPENCEDKDCWLVKKFKENNSNKEVE